jgi:hypothetical protein
VKGLSRYRSYLPRRQCSSSDHRSAKQLHTSVSSVTYARSQIHLVFNWFGSQVATSAVASVDFMMASSGSENSDEQKWGRLKTAADVAYFKALFSICFEKLTTIARSVCQVGETRSSHRFRMLSLNQHLATRTSV